MKKDEIDLLYQKYYYSLFLFAFSLTHQKADAEDLVMNTFVKALLSFEDGNLKAWLYTVLKNEFYNMTKKKKYVYTQTKIHFDCFQSSDDVLKECLHEEHKRWLYKNIYQLPKIEREVILLSVQDDLSDVEISQILNISVNYMRVIRHRVKEKLRKLCQEEGYL
ncbi:MAG: RNA polymerase sigma factor [Coprobacillus cateniformis]|uniref:RNA polymerase sigma factor n=1 Tax=Longibaculum muris TaxID=1796628 RepID=UPI003AB3F660|nr:RNA polymerase sigma factor [Coprobacillus cateniformis]